MITATQMYESSKKQLENYKKDLKTCEDWREREVIEWNILCLESKMEVLLKEIERSDYLEKIYWSFPYLRGAVKKTKSLEESINLIEAFLEGYQTYRGFLIELSNTIDGECLDQMDDDLKKVKDAFEKLKEISS